jgi:hypothetical protein
LICLHAQGVSTSLSKHDAKVAPHSTVFGHSNINQTSRNRRRSNTSCDRRPSWKVDFTPFSGTLENDKDKQHVQEGSPHSFLLSFVEMRLTIIGVAVRVCE